MLTITCGIFRETYTTQDLLKDVGGQKVVKTVCVEAWRHAQQTGWAKEPIEETAFAAADSTRHKNSTQVAAGIVGYVDLTEGDRATRLIEAYIAAGWGGSAAYVCHLKVYSTTRNLLRDSDV